MKNRPFNLHPRAALVATALLGMAAGLGSTGAYAAGTLSGTTISNLATLSYAAGGVNQPNIGSSAAGNSSGAGTATTFVVDNKVNLTVAEGNSTFTSVVPGSVNQVTTFTVTNTGNTAQGYALAAANVAATVFGTADNIDVSNIRVFVDANANGVYDSGTDTAVNIATLAPDATATVFVVADVPVAATNGQQASVSLTATTTTNNTTTPVVQTAGADTAGVDIVFADPLTTANGSGTDPGQVARDAKGFAYDAYRIASAVISVQKTATVLCDPFNGVTNQKNIPGSIVRWTIVVSNAAGAGASATLAQVADALDSNTTFDPNLVAPTSATTCSSTAGVPENGVGKGFKMTVGGTSTRTGFPKFLTGASDSDGATFTSPNVTIDYSQGLNAIAGYGAGELKPGESVTVYFNATIN
jgi:hypothetical protein